MKATRTDRRNVRVAFGLMSTAMVLWMIALAPNYERMGLPGLVLGLLTIGVGIIVIDQVYEV